MSYRLRCEECKKEFYPNWHLDKNDHNRKEKCPECMSTKIKRIKLTKKKMLKDLSVSLEKNGCGG